MYDFIAFWRRNWLWRNCRRESVCD